MKWLRRLLKGDPLQKRDMFSAGGRLDREARQFDRELEQINQLIAGQDVDGLIKVLQNKSSTVRIYAVGGLATVSVERAILVNERARVVEALEAALNDEDTTVSGFAAQALEELGVQPGRVAEGLCSRGWGEDRTLFNHVPGSKNGGGLNCMSAVIITGKDDANDTALEAIIGQHPDLEGAHVTTFIDHEGGVERSVKEENWGQLQGVLLARAGGPEVMVQPVYCCYGQVIDPSADSDARYMAPPGGWHYLMAKVYGPTAGTEAVAASSDAHAPFQEGVNALTSGDYEDALRCFDSVIELQPRSPDAWNNKAFALANLERDEEAIECCNNAIAINSEYPDPWEIKGRVLGRLGKMEEALQALDRFTQIAPAEYASRVEDVRKVIDQWQARSLFKNTFEIRTPKEED